MLKDGESVGNGEKGLGTELIYIRRSGEDLSGKMTQRTV